MFMVMTTNGTTTLPSSGIFMAKKRSDIDAITGATISGGKRSITVIEIDEDKIDQGLEFGMKQLLKIKSITKMILSLNHEPPIVFVVKWRAKDLSGT